MGRKRLGAGRKLKKWGRCWAVVFVFCKGAGRRGVGVHEVIKC